MSDRSSSDQIKAITGKDSDMSGRRIVVAGKGGVGKTALSAAICLLGSTRSRRVLALDQDAQQNLGHSLGLDAEEAIASPTISEQLDHIEERVDARPEEGLSGLRTLNLDISDITERFGVSISPSLNLLVMGGVVHANGGCLCPENAILGRLVRQLDVRGDDLIVMDTQAGLEPFGRSVAKGFRTMLIVAEPYFTSLKVAERLLGLAREMKIEEVHLVLNKMFDPIELEMAAEVIDLDRFDRVFTLPFDPTVRENEADVSGLIDGGGPYIGAVSDMFSIIEGDDDP